MQYLVIIFFSESTEPGETGSHSCLTAFAERRQRVQVGNHGRTRSGTNVEVVKARIRDMLMSLGR